MSKKYYKKKVSLTNKTSLILKFNKKCFLTGHEETSLKASTDLINFQSPVLRIMGWTDYKHIFYFYFHFLKWRNFFQTLNKWHWQSFYFIEHFLRQCCLMRTCNRLRRLRIFMVPGSFHAMLNFISYKRLRRNKLLSCSYKTRSKYKVVEFTILYYHTIASNKVI